MVTFFLFLKDDYSLLKELGKKNDIVILRPDKGKGVVILDKSDYVDKMNNILNDDTKFFKVGDLTFPLIYKQEDKINRLLKNLLDNGVIKKETS